MPIKKKYQPSLIVGHILFWVVWTAFPLYYNIQWFGIPMACLRVIPPSILLILVAYINIGIIITFLFRNDKFIWYRMVLVYLILMPITFFSIECTFDLINCWSKIELNINFSMITEDGTILNMTPNSRGDRFPRFIIFGMVLFDFFTSSMYGIAREFLYKERQAAELRAINIKNELKLLRRQINPHFLFNALNNLYAIVQLKPDKAGDFVLKLSEMLRYVTYDGQEEKVLLQKEVEYLNNYIYFQQWRDSKWQNIQLDIDLQGLENMLIEPMLLLPFVENAFKHSYEYEQQMWMTIVLKKEVDQLYFKIGNNRSQLQTQKKVDDEYTGIGIENIQKRLTILHPHTHQLNIRQDKDSFWATLTLKL
jgi:hypothetical protein